MKRVRIVGGPAPHTVKVVDAETGAEVCVRAIEFCAWAVGQPLEVKLTMVAEVDAEAYLTPAEERLGALETAHQALVERLKQRRSA